MDKNRFDGFTRQLAKRENRRQAIKTLFAGGAATAATVLVGGETSAAKTDCCPADHPTLCNLTCTDTIDDPHNCGGCGVTCDPDERCYKSACESTSITHCAVVADCPGSDTECSTRTCKKGICGVTYAASGKKVANQTAGDCKKNVCDGAGHIISITDNTDKPAATGECTTGICVDGVPHQNALPSGRKCTNGKCDGAGHCSGSTSGCTLPTDCPPTGNECVSRTCADGVCGVTNAPSGTVTSNQTAGDCKKTVCDGAGGTEIVNDDTDIPTSSNDCVASVCTNGVSSQSPVDAGTLCDGGNCDGSGNCIACLSAADCPGVDTGCAIRFCNNGQCGTALTPYDTLTGVQTPGDCQKSICDGLGHVITVADDTDFTPPYYGDPCLDSICANGVPSHPFLAAGTACIGGGGICDGSGGCVQCLDDTYCPPTGIPNSVPSCIDGNCAYQCVPGYTNCPNGTGCIDTSIDPANCGSCGHACSIPNGHALCANGACALAGCLEGYADCNNNPADGCEVDVRNDPNNCGACNNKCGSGTTCVNSVCQ